MFASKRLGKVVPVAAVAQDPVRIQMTDLGVI